MNEKTWQEHAAARTEHSSEAVAQKVRLQFDFTPDARDRVKALARDTGAGTMSAVVHDALALYEAIGPAHLRGAEILIRENGADTRVVLARR